jgi:beta-mannosidase
VRGELRLRVMSLDGQLLRDERKTVELAPLSAARTADYADADLLGGADPASTVAVFELRAEGEPASRGVVYFKAAKDMRWPDAGLHADLRRDGQGYLLELRADRLARAVWIDFGDLDAEPADNALTLLPGESLTMRVASKSSLAALRKSLRVQSVADVLDSGKSFTKTR